MSQPAKDLLRRQYRALRRALPTQARAHQTFASVQACQELMGRLQPRVVASYCATAYELDLAGLHAYLWQRGERVLLPRVCGPGQLSWHEVGPQDALCSGAHGISEPDAVRSPARLLLAGTLLFVPGVAFTSAGHRLGQGGGFYDRFLPVPGVVSIGVGYDCQRCDELPLDEHDRHVDGVILGGRVIREPMARFET